MFDLRTISTVTEAEAALDEVTRHRIDLIQRPPARKPSREAARRDPKLRIVWLLRSFIRRCKQRDALTRAA